MSTLSLERRKSSTHRTTQLVEPLLRLKDELRIKDEVRIFGEK